VVVVFSGGAAAARIMPLEAGRIELGRTDGSPGQLDDGRVSRSHALVERDGERWMVTDLGSQNGTFVDGERILPRAPTPVARVVRVGDTLVVPCDDVGPIERAGVRRVEGFVRGPAMQAVLADAERAGRAGTMLHVRGETGTGKEGVAQAFHRAAGRAAHALVAVNCAAIPEGLAERLLFGARRGAYSGIEADAAGYLQEADGGTLFLDEIAELDLPVQAKLLRVLESHEVLPLGASRPRKVDFALCSATNRDLRALVAAGALREDLYFRIATPAVTLPPLRERPEEIPALIAHELAARPPRLVPHVSLVEQCLLRPWPGNVRELLAELRAAAQAAVVDGRVTAAHLAAMAGSVFGSAMPEPRSAAAAALPADEPRKRITRDDAEWRQRIEEALRASAGNIAAAARSLGLHRTQLRRLMERHAISVGAPAGRVGDDTAD
jgi:transcriptional regulator with GAF, ATPase, and Fis domain